MSVMGHISDIMLQAYTTHKDLPRYTLSLSANTSLSVLKPYMSPDWTGAYVPLRWGNVDVEIDQTFPDGVVLLTERHLP